MKAYVIRFNENGNTQDIAGVHLSLDGAIAYCEKALNMGEKFEIFQIPYDNEVYMTSSQCYSSKEVAEAENNDEFNACFTGYIITEMTVKE